MSTANQIAIYLTMAGIVLLSLYPHNENGSGQTYSDNKQGAVSDSTNTSSGGSIAVDNINNEGITLGSEPTPEPINKPEPNIDSEHFLSLDNETKVNAIRSYYEKHNCPLAEYAEVFVEVANKNSLDWRLLVAIGMKESSGGKRLVGNNPFGFGYLTFRDFEHAIRYVGSAIAGNNPQQHYFHEGMTVYEILWKYNGTVEAGYPARVMSIMNSIGECAS